MLQLIKKYDQQELDKLSKAELIGIILSQQKDAGLSQNDNLDLRLYQKILESIDQGILLLDRNNNIQWLNSAFSFFSGYLSKQLIHHNLSEILYPKLDNESSTSEDECEPSINKKIYKLKLAWGTLLDIHLNITSYLDHQGIYYKWVSINPHVQLTKTSVHQKDFLPKFINSLPLSLIYADQNFKIHYVNKKFEEQFRVFHDQVLNQSLKDLFTPELYQKLEPNLRKAISGEELHFKLKTSNQEGNHQVLEYHLIPFMEQIQKQEGVIILINKHNTQPYSLIQHKELSQNLHMAVDVVQVGVWSFDLKTRHLEANNVIYDMFQLDRNTFPAQPENWLSLVHPEDRQPMIQHIRSVILRKSYQDKVEFQYKANLSDDTIKYFRVVFKIIPDDQNVPTKLLGINLDVTNTAQFENQLIEREKLYRTLAENFPNGIILILDKTLKYKFAAGSEVHNIIEDIDQLENRSLFDTASSEVINKAKENLFDVFQGHTRNFEIKFKKNLNYLISAIPLYDNDGSISEIMVVSQNITELKKAEERIRKLFVKRYHLTRKLKIREAELKNTLKEVLSLNKALSQSQAYQKAILNNTSHAFYLINEDLKVLTFNRVARERIKIIYNKKIQKGRSFINYLKESEITDFKLKFEQALQGQIIEDSRKITYENNQTVWISCRHAPAYDHMGNIFAVTYSTLDITQQKETENALTVAKERAEELIKLKTNFLANMSHEIRTPLNGILGLAQVIAKETDLNQIKEYVKLQRESGERLLNTLTGILSLSQLEAERKNLTFKPIAINQIVKENTKSLDALALNKKIFLIAHTYYQELYCLGDENLLFKILNNLIGNGIKFTLKGYVLVETGLKPNDPSFIFIRVKDTGIGIQETFLSKIFDPFTQESSGQNRNFEGSGLGLSIIKKYVELLGGNIKVSSKKGQGSIFEITLPRYKH